MEIDSTIMSNITHHSSRLSKVKRSEVKYEKDDQFRKKMLECVSTCLTIGPKDNYHKIFSDPLKSNNKYGDEMNKLLKNLKSNEIPSPGLKVTQNYSSQREIYDISMTLFVSVLLIAIIVNNIRWKMMYMELVKEKNSLNCSKAEKVKVDEIYSNTMSEDEFAQHSSSGKNDFRESLQQWVSPRKDSLDLSSRFSLPRSASDASQAAIEALERDDDDDGNYSDSYKKNSERDSEESKKLKKEESESETNNIEKLKQRNSTSFLKTNPLETVEMKNIRNRNKLLQLYEANEKGKLPPIKTLHFDFTDIYQNEDEDENNQKKEKDEIKFTEMNNIICNGKLLKIKKSFSSNSTTPIQNQNQIISELEDENDDTKYRLNSKSSFFTPTKKFPLVMKSDQEKEKILKMYEAAMENRKKNNQSLLSNDLRASSPSFENSPLRPTSISKLNPLSELRSMCRNRSSSVSNKIVFQDTIPVLKPTINFTSPLTPKTISNSDSLSEKGDRKSVKLLIKQFQSNSSSSSLPPLPPFTHSVSANSRSKEKELIKESIKATVECSISSEVLRKHNLIYSNNRNSKIANSQSFSNFSQSVKSDDDDAASLRTLDTSIENNEMLFNAKGANGSNGLPMLTVNFNFEDVYSEEGENRLGEGETDMEIVSSRTVSDFNSSSQSVSNYVCTGNGNGSKGIVAESIQDRIARNRSKILSMVSTLVECDLIPEPKPASLDFTPRADGASSVRSSKSKSKEYKEYREYREWLGGSRSAVNSLTRDSIVSQMSFDSI